MFPPLKTRHIIPISHLLLILCSTWYYTHVMLTDNSLWHFCTSLDYRSNDACTTNSLGRQIASPSGQKKICFLSRIIKIMSSHGAKVRKVLVAVFLEDWRHQRGAVSLNSLSSTVTQNHYVCFIHLGYFPRPPSVLGGGVELNQWKHNQWQKLTFPE